MSAYLELQRTGRVGPAFAEQLYATVRQAVHHGGYPPPDGQRWHDDDYLEIGHAFLTDTDIERRLTALALRATDDDSFGKLLWIAVVNFLRDRARQTERGLLHRQLTDFVRRDDNPIEELATPAGTSWTLPDISTSEPWHGDERMLIAAAWAAKDVRLQRWRNAGRRSPIAEADSLSRVLQAVIQAAEAPVLVTHIRRVVEHRFALSAPPTVVDIDDEPAQSAAPDDPAEQATTRIAATEVLDQLTARERVTVAYYNLPVRDLADLLNVSKSTAANTRSKVQKILTGTLSGLEDAEAIWEQLKSMAADWTEATGASSVQNESP